MVNKTNKVYCCMILVLLPILVFITDKAYCKSKVHPAHYYSDPINNEVKTCHACFISTDVEEKTGHLFLKRIDTYFSGKAKLEWQTICLCDESFKPERNKPCEAYDFETGKSHVYL